MRTFEERKAEIFLRSEKRIKLRKKNRIRALSIAVPLCICAAVLSVVLQPEKATSIQIENETSDQETDLYCSDVTSTQADGIADSDNACFSTGIIVKTSDGALKNYTYAADSERYEEILEAVNSAFGETDGGSTDNSYSYSAGGTEENDETKGTSVKAGEGSENKVYTVTVYDDGIKTVYTLNDKILTCEQTGQQVTLEDEEYKNLIKSLDMQ